jgi:1-acyl-sn-glycerol-3-phosphate acyltransferase
MPEAPAAPILKKHYRDLSPDQLDQACRDNWEEINRVFDIQYLRTLNAELVPYLNLYFRPEFVGFDEMPDRKETSAPVIFACNHSGFAFPWDAIVFGSELFHKHQYEMSRLIRPLSAPMLSGSSLMNPYLITDIWKRCGAVDATGFNFETLMRHADSHVLIYPEGVPGIGKGFNRRYQLQKFSTSFIHMALKHKATIHGISCVNGEWINPFGYASKRLNRLMNKIGVPYLPIALQTPLLLLQPWLFYYALPAKLIFVRGREINPSEFTGGKAYEDLTEFDIRRVRDQVQEIMQQELNEAVEKYGRHPYRLRELGRNLVKNFHRLPYWTPIGWPALFTEFDRRFEVEGHHTKDVTKGWFKFWRIVLRNPIIFAYYLPVIGWIPILIKGLRDKREVPMWEGAKG